MEKKITISNPFHNTSINIMVPASWDADDALVNLATTANAYAKYARVRRTLCGVGGCRCSSMWRAEEAKA